MRFFAIGFWVLILSMTLAASSPTTQPSMAAWSDWGINSAGLQARAQAPAETEQNASLTVNFQLRCDVAMLPTRVREFNKFFYEAHCQFCMRNLASGQQFRIEPYDPTAGMPAFDDGSDLVQLDGKKVIALSAEFPLRMAKAGMISGQYECWVDYSTHRTGNANPKSTADIWAGDIETGKLLLNITPEIARYQTILVPRFLRVDKDGFIRLRSAEAEPLRILVGNGMFLVTEVSDGSGNLGSIEGGPPEMDTVNSIGNVNHLPRAKNAVIHIQIIETSDPPHHMWFPVGKTIWQKSFVVTQPANSGPH
ncbi:MAG TPA: hypothetical protein VGG19_05140 [Tepidisphaeraceae bacterium]|jgi:hypothetical protein